MELTPKKILVARGGAIGDFILTLPVLAALRRRFPTVRLEILGLRHVTPLAVAGGWADTAHSLESAALAPLFGSEANRGQPAPAFLAGVELIVSYLHDPEKIFQANVAGVSKAHWIAGPARPDESRNVHATEQLLVPLRRLGIVGADPVPRLKLSASTGLPWQGRWLALHPGSGSPRKNWPELQWIEILRDLVAATDLNLLLIGGEAESECLPRLAGGLPPERVHLAVQQPLVELAASLGRCMAYVGHDSGISHLAAAVGLPGMILWGDTNETVWRPRSDRMVILRNSGGLAALSARSVFERLARLLARIRSADGSR